MKPHDKVEASLCVAERLYKGENPCIPSAILTRKLASTSLVMTLRIIGDDPSNSDQLRRLKGVFRYGEWGCCVDNERSAVA